MKAGKILCMYYQGRIQADATKAWASVRIMLPHHKIHGKDNSDKTQIIFDGQFW